MFKLQGRGICFKRDIQPRGIGLYVQKYLNDLLVVDRGRLLNDLILRCHWAGMYGSPLSALRGRGWVITLEWPN